ncbi:MAG TPA: hypothetical protein VNP73_00030 [Actinomycetota bacterium]|nr:hypothetical protein [Actinomycetota bacterium]
MCRASGEIEAHLLSGRLGACGIETHHVADRAAGEAWLHNGASPWIPIAVWVRRHQLDDARIVLAEIAFDQPAHESRSTVSRWRAPMTWWTAAIALGLIFTGIGFHRMAQYMDSL